MVRVKRLTTEGSRVEPILIIPSANLDISTFSDVLGPDVSNVTAEGYSEGTNHQHIQALKVSGSCRV